MKTFFVVISFLVLQFQLNAQLVAESNVPTPVKQQLNRLFNNPSVNSWTTDGVNYHASFSYNNAPTVATFTGEGNFVQKKSVIPTAELPEAVMNYMNTHMATHTIVQCMVISNSSNSLTYAVEVSGRILTFLPNGTLVDAIMDPANSEH